MKKILISVAVLMVVGYLIYKAYNFIVFKNDETWVMDTRFENKLNTYVSIAFFEDITLVDAYNGKTLFIPKGQSVGGYLRLTPLKGQTLKQYMIQANYGGVSSGYYNVEIAKIQSVTVTSV